MRTNRKQPMLPELVRFIKSHFQRSKNGLMQVLLLNALSFLALLLLKIVWVIGGYEAAYTTLLRYGSLPASWSVYMRQPWSLLTHFWVHVSFLPTLWGLLLLYTLGQVVMHRLGSRRFVVPYLLGGLAGGLFFLLLYHVSPHYQVTPALLSGFGGSLYAVMVASATLAPEHALLFFLLGPLKLKYIVGFLVLLALVNLVGAEPSASIAHLGGALLGYIYVKQFEGCSWLRRCWGRFPRPRKNLKIQCPPPSTVSWLQDKRNVSEDPALLDHILDKVAVSGYASLTPAEKQYLFNAGK